MQTLALDLGSHSVRAGLAGQDQPRVIEPSSVGVTSNEFSFPCDFATRKTRTHVVNVHDAVFEGTTKRTSVKNSIPSTIPALDYLLDSVLFPANGNMNRHSTPVVFSFPVFSDSRKADKKSTTRKYITAMVHSLFEFCEVPSLFARPDPVLAAFSCGRTSAVVADFGASHTTISRVSEGSLAQIASWKFGGAELDSVALKRLSAEHGGRFPTPFDISDVEDSFVKQAQLQSIQEMKHNFFRVSPVVLNPPPERMRAAKKQIHSVMYKLPDNTELDVASVYEYLPEIYFNPRVVEKYFVADFPGVHASLAVHFQSQNSESTTGDRALVLCGGSVQMTGLQARLQSELPDDVSILCPALFARPFASWTGASILGSIAACAGNLAISSKEYLEQGSDRIVDLLISS